MSFIKGGAQKYSKRRTDSSVPAIVAPQITGTGISLTGSQDIDVNNLEILYFHVAGVAPAQTLLYVYAERFHQAFYTELGDHEHGPGTLSTDNTSINSHQHSGSVNISGHGHSISIGNDSHNHRILTRVDGTDSWIDTLGGGSPFYDRYQQVSPYNPWIEADTHNHSASTGSVTGTTSPSFSTGSVSGGSTTHDHDVDAGITSSEGITPDGASVRTSGSPKKYFDSLKIEIDGVDRTAELLIQSGLAKFGDGTSGHQLVTAGVELDITGYITVPGQHKIVFSLLSGVDNGGKVRYNLYTVTA